MKWMRTSLVLLLTLAALATWLAAPVAAQETIKIGFFAPITGPVAADGEQGGRAAVERGCDGEEQDRLGVEDDEQDRDGGVSGTDRDVRVASLLHAALVRLELPAVRVPG